MSSSPSGPMFFVKMHEPSNEDLDESEVSGWA